MKSRAEFPTVETISGKGKLFIGLVRAIELSYSINEQGSELIGQLFMAARTVGGLTEAELDRANKIGTFRGNQLLRSRQVHPNP